MTQVNSIVFTQAQDNKKAVVADRWVVHALYVQNKAIVESLGGTIITGVGGFRAEFKKIADAKKFIEQAVTEMSKREYNATRKAKEIKNPKSQPKGKGNKKSNAQPKGIEVVTLTDAEGNKFTVPKSALTQEQAPAKKGKGNATPTKSATTTKQSKSKKADAQKKPTGKGNQLGAPAQKTLEEMKKSILNRAASAYNIAHGGEATTFDRLGKSEKAIKEFMPAAKAGLLKSAKWAKASKTYGLTEDMLG